MLNDISNIRHSSSTSDRLTEARILIEDEAIAADEQRWDDWLACYDGNCEIWIPTWRGDGTLTNDPHLELSHIYYSSRSALEDRIARFTSAQSPASNPPPRTVHLVGHVRLRSDDDSTDAVIRTRHSWRTSLYFPYARKSVDIFGMSEYDLNSESTDLKIKRKKVILMNDFVETMLEIHMF